ncbi:MAG: pyridoxamine 5'-phosphate oxidase family protein [Gemmatimonadota bacterium]
MPLQALTSEEIATFLARQRIVRVAFHTAAERYLVPLGYTWQGGALCGAMAEGRKTRLAREDPRIAFQVDDTLEAGLWEWTSVSGEGKLEWVEEPREAEVIERRMAEAWTDAPQWLAEEWKARQDGGEVACFRIRPHHLTGCRSVPPEAMRGNG